MKQQSGFTLIELIMVIVILGILAATALPKFADLSGDARRSSVDGMLGAVRAAATIAHATALAQNVTASVTMEGLTVALVNGYPATAAGGIDNAVTFTGYTYTAATGVFSQTGAPTPATCGVTYAEPAAANGVPTYTRNVGGC